MKAKAKYAWVAFCAVLTMSFLLSGSAIQVPSGTWQSTGSMSESRDGAAAAGLPDGRVLVTGGNNGSGPTASVDIFSAAGVFSAGPNMLAPRSGHTATTLDDGRVLVVGGSSSAAAEIYDPANNSWSNAGSLSTARSGHTATKLPDGRVLIAGGSAGGGSTLASLEIYDPASNSFSSAGNLASARKNHAAAILGRWPAANNRLIDRQVIFVGGVKGGSVLASTEIYDPADGSVSAGPALPGPRKNASAVTVLGGYVYVAGGNDGSNDLSSALLISRDGDVTAAANLLAPRSGHFAVRLPGANSVLIAGGSAGSSAEIFIPWSNSQIATGSMGAARVGAASASVAPGLYLAAGGSGSSSSEVYGYATVDTDKNDYIPGEVVAVSGSGWQAGETVNLVLHEDVDPPFHADIVGSAVADANGNISVPNFYTVELHDLGLRFFLTATGDASGHQARTTFTDAPSADIDQCRNGPADDPNDCEDLGGASGWVNGNVGEQQGHLAEGLSIPYRVRLEEVPLGNDIDIYFSYDTKHSDKVAIDHLTHFQCLEPHTQFGHPAEVVDPTSGFDNGGTYNLGNGSAFPIPAPTFPGAPSDAPGFPTFAGSLSDCTRTMTIWGGTITEIAYDALDMPGGAQEGEGTYADGVNQSTTFIRVRFTPTEANVLLAWGGHIASRVDWGFDQGVPRSAGGISGSPYHMRLEDWEFASGPDAGDNVTNLGNQDRSLSAAAIIPTGTIKIVKDAIPDDPQDFTFTGSGTGIPASFLLDDDGLGGDDACTGGNCSMMRTFTLLSGESATFTETPIPNGWDLDSIVCDVVGEGLTPGDDSTFPTTSNSVTVNVEDGEDIVCTFTNIKQGKIIVEKQTIPDGATQSFTFSGDVAGSIQDDGMLMEEVAAGSYTSTETVPSGWTLKSIVCDDSDSAADGSVPEQANFEVAAGETVTCVFTNIKNPFITIEADDTNEVGTPHTFKVTVAQDAGNGAEGISGVIVDVDFTPVPGTVANDTCANPGTNGMGMCTVDINSNVAGVFTAHASASVNIMGVVFNIETDGLGENSDDAVKTYVEAKIQLSPLNATNNINTAHTITATVMENDGGGFDPSPGETVTFSLLNNTANAAFVGGVNTCVTDGAGQCSVQINSSTPGSVDIHASVDVHVGGLTLHRETDSTHGSSGNANKIYVAANIIVIKECEPLEDPQLFTFAGPGDIDGTDLACGGQVDSGLLAPGNYEVSETVPDGWDLTQITCDDDDNSGGLVDIPAVDLVLDANETITCTFHNVKRGQIMIQKINIGRADAFPVFGYDSDPDLPDVTDGGPGSINNSPGAPHANMDFTITTEQTGADPLCQGIFTAAQFATADCTGKANIADVLPGSYTLVEQQPNSVTWRLIELVCSDPDGGTTTTIFDDTGTPANGGQVDLDVDPGEMIVCTFVNRFGGRIRVVKQTDPDGSTQEFEFDANYVNGTAAFSLTDADVGDGNDTDPNTDPPSPNNLSDWQPPNADADHYMITETVPSGWVNDDISCYIESGLNAGQSVGVVDLANHKVTVPLTGGQIVRCTFHNSALGRIKLTKTVVFGDPATEFDFDNNGPDADFVDCQLHDGEMCDTGFVLSPGVYTAQELVLNALPAGAWRLDNFAMAAIQCTVDGDGTSVTFSGAAMGDTDVFEPGDDTANITLGAGGDVSCTFFNRLGGFIKIVKACDPEVDPTNSMFEFDTDIVRTDGTHPQDPTLMCGGMHLTLWQPVDDAVNGTEYNVTELAPPAGWTLTDLVCDDDASANPSVEDVANRHATINLDGGETVTCTFTNTLEQGEGCTPGYWKTHTGLGPQGNAWTPTPYDPDTLITSVWTIPTCVSDADTKIDESTLLQALSFKGGSGVGGAARNLLRAAVAALLNASHPDVNYPRSEADVIADVQAALDSCDRNTMLTLAGELDEDNNLGCPLNNPSTASGDSPVAPIQPAEEPATPAVPTSTTGTDSSFTQPSSDPNPFRLSVGGVGGGVVAEEPKPAVEVAKSQITSFTFKDGVLELSGIALDRTGKPLSGVVGLTLALYSEKDGAPVSLDLHNVELDSNGNYTLRLTLTEGVLQLEPSWLGVQVQGQAEQPRVSLR